MKTAEGGCGEMKTKAIRECIDTAGNLTRISIDVLNAAERELEDINQRVAELKAIAMCILSEPDDPHVRCLLVEQKDSQIAGLEEAVAVKDEALETIASIVECEGIKISVDGEYECSPKKALTEIAIEAKHASSSEPSGKEKYVGPFGDEIQPVGKVLGKVLGELQNLHHVTEIEKDIEVVTPASIIAEWLTSTGYTDECGLLVCRVCKSAADAGHDDDCWLGNALKEAINGDSI